MNNKQLESCVETLRGKDCSKLSHFCYVPEQGFAGNAKEARSNLTAIQIVK